MDAVNTDGSWTWIRATNAMSRRLGQFETWNAERPDPHIQKSIVLLRSLYRLALSLEATEEARGAVPGFHHVVLDLIGDSVKISISPISSEEFRMLVVPQPPGGSASERRLSHVKFDEMPALIAGLLREA